MNISKYEIKRHLSDATAISSFVTPISASIEKYVAGMSNLVSIKSRATSVGLLYLGLANLTKARDYSLKHQGINDESSEKKKGMHDILFGLGCILAIRPLIYLGCGETDWKKIAIGTAGISIVGGILTYPMGYLVDVYRDITGLKESKRTPKWIKEKSSTLKKGLLAAVTATSLLTTTAIYTMHSKKDIYLKEPIKTEQQISKEVLEKRVLD